MVFFVEKDKRIFKLADFFFWRGQLLNTMIDNLMTYFNCIKSYFMPCFC